MVNRFRNDKSVFLLDGALIIAIVFLALLRQPRSLLDYERLCRETNSLAQKEEIALAAVNFLIQQSAPDSIAYQIKQAVAEENLHLPTKTFSFSALPTVLNDSLVGLYDDSLTVYLPKLFWMRRHRPDSVHQEQLLAVRTIAARIDSCLQYSYWLPLFDFLEHTDDQQWQCWRLAAKSAYLSMQATRNSRFEPAKCFALSGLQFLAHIPDRRLQLELYLRLQNPLVEGRDSAFNIGFTLAEKIIRESQRAGYFLRLVSMRFNLGNQFFQFGRFDEALENYKAVLQLTHQQRHFQSKFMRWYAAEVMERMTAVLYELGDYSAMLSYIHQYGNWAKDTRQKTLYHTNCGMAARLAGDFQTAEDEFKKAIASGKGDSQTIPDLANVWSVYLMLGDLYLRYNLPEEALAYFHEAKSYVERGDKSFLNADRLSEYWLYVSEVRVYQNDLRQAQVALNEAKNQPSDSPLWRVKSLLSAAKLHESLGQLTESNTALLQARAICQIYGMTIYEIDALLRGLALSCKAPEESRFPQYSVKELETLIAKVNKSGARQQLVHSLSIAIETASRHGQYNQATLYANWLLRETEALSRFYDQEQRLVFFQHSTYERVKAAINLDLRLRKIDSAFVKLDYVKSRALRQPTDGLIASHLPYTDLAKLRQRLQPEEAIVDYFITEDTLYAFVVTASGVKVFPSAVRRRELQALVQEYMAELAQDNREAEKDNGYTEQRQEKRFAKAVQLSHQLYNKTLKALTQSLEWANRLYIVPDEFLHLLPFSTLALQNAVETEFLINRKAINYLPAAALLLANSGDARTNHLYPQRLLASIDSAMHGAAQITARLATLKNVQVTIKTRWENYSDIKAHLRNSYQTYFFYAHAKANWNDPWQSYIQFALPFPQPYGKLTGADVDSGNWRGADLVILAGCETSGNRIYSGAGLSGLQRIFLGAGAQQVMATLWQVDAADVAPQMSNFLEAWQRTGDAASALQQMQQAAIARLKIDPYFKYPHPRYWGAYNLTGADPPASTALANVTKQSQ